MFEGRLIERGTADYDVARTEPQDWVTSRFRSGCVANEFEPR